jgi:TolB-like protein
MRRFVRVALALTAIAMVTPAVIEAQAKPVVAVLYFDNNSIGRDRADFDGVGKGVAEMLITDMAQNSNLRVVERDRIQALLVEQNLTKEKTIDPQTAIRLGKIIGAQYMITGGFMSDGRGTYVFTSRVINVETSQISHPKRINSKGDDVLGMIAQLSAWFNSEIKLPALQVGVGAAPSSATPAGHAASQPTAPQATQPLAETTKAGEPAAAPTKPAAQIAQAKTQRKMDMRTAMLFSKALEEEDAGNRSKAVELYRLVVDKFPDYAPAQNRLAKLSSG